ncbi:hypothetical protein ACQYAD_17320 [Neobacillus sp. SM06]|uniref:hypothetical protein n=1 Tax=Neobacillus sp. SM06 TaxID=3422492 RepID=UPI003D2CA3CA
MRGVRSVIGLACGAGTGRGSRTGSDRELGQLPDRSGLRIGARRPADRIGSRIGAGRLPNWVSSRIGAEWLAVSIRGFFPFIRETWTFIREVFPFIRG